MPGIHLPLRLVPPEEPIPCLLRRLAAVHGAPAVLRAPACSRQAEPGLLPLRLHRRRPRRQHAALRQERVGPVREEVRARPEREAAAAGTPGYPLAADAGAAERGLLLRVVAVPSPAPPRDGALRRREHAPHRPALRPGLRSPPRGERAAREASDPARPAPEGPACPGAPDRPYRLEARRPRLRRGGQPREVAARRRGRGCGGHDGHRHRRCVYPPRRRPPRDLLARSPSGSEARARGQVQRALPGRRVPARAGEDLRAAGDGRLRDVLVRGACAGPRVGAGGGHLRVPARGLGRHGLRHGARLGEVVRSLRDIQRAPGVLAAGPR
mmetsp:Transcript_60920/g.158051  ORF Transcript_60920/g.158051 Transcript_60920/m.158051 type:complete len:326 (+) Transcript_60920:428-1405(+)